MIVFFGILLLVLTPELLLLWLIVEYFKALTRK